MERFFVSVELCRVIMQLVFYSATFVSFLRRQSGHGDIGSVEGLHHRLFWPSGLWLLWLMATLLTSFLW